MASKIKIKRSAVAGKVPLTTDLELSELAVNTNDGRLYTKKDNGTESIVEIGGPDFGSRNVTTTGTSTAASFIPTSSTAPTNGVYLPAANSVAISTNSVGRLFVNASGLVGVATNAPSYQLDVNGATRVNGDLGISNTSIINGISQDLYLQGNSGYGIIFRTNGASERLRITSAGLVGIGTSSPQRLLHVHNSSTADARLKISNGTTGSALYDGFELNCGSTGVAEIIQWEQQPIYFYTNNGSAVDARLAIDSAGRLLVGTSTSAVSYSDWRLQISGQAALGSYLGATTSAYNFNFIKSRSSSVGTYTIVASGDKIGGISFNGDDGTDYETPAASIEAFVDGTPGANDMPGRLVFSTTADGASSPTERMRINASGALHASTNGTYLDANATYNEISQSNNNYGLVVHASSSGFTSSVLHLTASRNTSNSTFNYLEAYNAGATTFRLIIRDSGNVVNVNNSYGAISDIKLKENIVDASSQWDDVKALHVRKYNFKEGQTHTQIGLVAQEVELVSPGLVSESPDRDEDGNDLGTVTKSVNYSVLYMKAVKALQEAMERIEQLEAEMVAVKAQLS